MPPHGTLRAMNQNIDYNTDYPTDAGRVITNNMGAIHMGHTFSSHMATDALVYGTPWDVLIQTPADRYMHLKFINAWLDEGRGCIQIWEDIESYTGGWIVDMHNRRRPSIISTSTTAAPTTTTGTTTTGTTTTGTTTTGTTTTGAPTTTSTTEEPHLYGIDAEADLRLTWTDKERFIYTPTEAGILPTYPGTTNVIIREGGIAVLGTAIELDAYRFTNVIRITADEWMDHEWIFKKDKLYLIRFWRVLPVVTTTSTTGTTVAPTTTAGPQQTTTPVPTTTSTTPVPTTSSTTTEAPTTTSTTPEP